MEKLGIDETKRKELETLFKEVIQLETSELEDYKKYKKLVDKFKEYLSLEKDLKVIVIDELDRCKSNYIIELLETIKHFFGVKNIIFVFLVNKEQLKSIVSTSYLTEDKCSEYFEKFFDIQFNLPELEYEDFIQIEYDKYNQFQTYELNNKRISEDNIKIYESIFLEAFISNCDSSIVSPRNFIRSFKKFKVLLTSLSDEERACYPLMIVLILYFIREEFLNKNIISKEEIKLDILFVKIFFLNFHNQKLEMKEIKNIISNDKNYDFNNIVVKEMFNGIDNSFYFIFSNVLLLKKSTHKYSLILKSNNSNNYVNFLLNSCIISFKKIIYNFQLEDNSNESSIGDVWINNIFLQKNKN